MRMITFRHTLAHLLCALVCVVGGLAACSPHSKEAAFAAQRVDDAYTLVEQQRYEAALLQLDSVHLLFPRQVEQRKRAKALEDSIHYVQACHSFRYSDSLLLTLLPQVDDLLKQFRFVRDEQYEDHGSYVYRSLQTGWNTNRCFLQAYVTDDRQTFVKSYYFGAKAIQQHTLSLAAADEQIQKQGSNHAFQAEGWHEIMTLAGDDALQVLNFVSAHTNHRIKVSAIGNNQAIYYLSDSEKEALDQTYRLGLLMNDIKTLEQTANTASAQMQRYEQKIAKQ